MTFQQRKSVLIKKPSFFESLMSPSVENNNSKRDTKQNFGLVRKESEYNEVSMKYRYELHQIQKVTEQAGLLKKKDNLFRRVSIVGRVIDPDIKLGMKLIHDKKVTIVDDKIDEEENEEINADNNKINHINSGHLDFKSNFDIMLAPKKIDEGIFDISDVSANKVISESEEDSESESEEISVKKLDTKLPIHKRKFSVFFKGGPDDDEDEDENVKKKKEYLDKRKKELGRIKKNPRRASILKINDNTENLDKFKLDEKPIEYDKVDNGSGSFELVKNYLTLPKKNNESKMNNDPNGPILKGIIRSLKNSIEKDSSRSLSNEDYKINHAIKSFDSNYYSINEIDNTKKKVNLQHNVSKSLNVIQNKISLRDLIQIEDENPTHKAVDSKKNDFKTRSGHENFFGNLFFFFLLLCSF